MTDGFAWWSAVARCWWHLGCGYCFVWAGSAARRAGTAALWRGWGGATDALFRMACRLYRSVEREIERFELVSRELYRIEWERRR